MKDDRRTLILISFVFLNSHSEQGCLEHTFRMTLVPLRKIDQLTPLLLSENLSKHDVNDLKTSNPKMSIVNRALSIPAIRDVVWEKLSWPKKFELPGTLTNLLYGRLSEYIHLPNRQWVDVPDNAPAPEMYFWKFSAKLMGRTAVTFNAVAASAEAFRRARRGQEGNR